MMSDKTFSDTIKERALDIHKCTKFTDYKRYYCIVTTDLKTNSQKLLHVCNNYTNSVMKFHECYKKFVDDEKYIVREISPLNVLIYKRLPGYVWSSKEVFASYKLLSYHNK